MASKYQEWMKELTFEEKCKFLTGYMALSSASNERVGIPNIEMSDGPHGVRRLVGHPKFPQDCNVEGGDCCFPTASAMASSWDREVAYNAGNAIAEDCKQEGIDLLLAPAVNMKRTPLCGRNFEYFSEDPVLSGEMAAAFIRGVQENGVGTSLKHFAANNQELDRSSISVEIDERTLREYYLEAFRIAIEKGSPETVMCAYNKLGGIWCSENPWLLKEVLRDEWGYKGLMVSDWGAVHNAPRAFANGMELQMPCNKSIYEDMLEGIEKGLLTEQDIDKLCGRVLEYIEHRVSCREEKKPYDRAKQHEKARAAAAECITLLKNEDNILPIDPKKYEKIVVFGNPAKDPIYMGGGSSHVSIEPESVDIPFDFIKEYCDGNTELIYEPMFECELSIWDKRARIRELSAEGGLAIVFAGDETWHESEEYERRRLTFPDRVNDVLEYVNQYFENVVVVMQSGACTTGTGWQNGVKGLIQMWLAGEGGGKAIADILFGKVNPSGKLSETFMTRLSDHLLHFSDSKKIRYAEGIDVGYRYYDRNPEDVWYPFGHGLSYTEFEYSDLSITPDFSTDPDGTVEVSFTLKNVGDRFGKEAVQLYVSPADNTVVRPEKELKEFAKVSLEAGESKRVSFTLDSHAFSYYNPYLHDWHVESGSYDILIAASSADIRLKGRYIVHSESDYTTSQKGGAMVL
ncbi:MAG: glycoside hydrolase family 3 C-terminal domain-containing protein [Clostridia bacterium]|nr:glycoside hydrolase family 3 C-terminal domain-containing protein [Clostridia bacterium]